MKCPTCEAPIADYVGFVRCDSCRRSICDRCQDICTGCGGVFCRRLRCILVGGLCEDCLCKRADAMETRNDPDNRLGAVEG